MKVIHYKDRRLIRLTLQYVLQTNRKSELTMNWVSGFFQHIRKNILIPHFHIWYAQKDQHSFTCQYTHSLNTNLKIMSVKLLSILRFC